MSSDKQDSLSSRLLHLSKKELQRRDVFGRTILHLVCIVGRFDLLKQLLKNPNLNANIVDYESCWTGLHCSIFYGKLSCARLLLNHKYDLIKAKDRSGLTAMDLYYSKCSHQNLKIFPTSIGENDTNYVQRFENPGDFKIDDNDVYWWDKDQRGGSDVYTFGSNINNQLGTGDTTDKTMAPYRVDIRNYRLEDTSLGIADRLVKPRLKTIELSKNHSIILTNENYNNILISGNSNKGRLGSESRQNNFRFNHMEFFQDDHIVEIAICDDFSLALNSSGEVYAWGLNNVYQLGFATDKIKGRMDTYSTEPKRVLHILKKYKIQGISCSKINSAAFCDKTLILWGLNAGQMSFVSTGEQVTSGKYKGIIQVPRDIQFQHRIRQVIANEDSTIVLLENNECHVLNGGAHLKYQLPLYKALNDDFEHFKPSVFSKKKKIIKLVSKSSSKIGILYNDGSVLNFGINTSNRTSNIKYSPVWKPRYSHLKCIDVDIGSDGSIIICVKSGCVYKRTFKSNKSNDIKFTKIEKLSKIVKVSCDSQFTSFGFIRDDIDQLALQLEKNSFYQDIVHLSPLTPAISNKKQTELIDVDESNLYIIDFLHRPNLHIEEEEYDTFHINYSNDDEEEDTKDPLLKSYRERWLGTQKIKSTSLPLVNDKFLELLQSEDLKYKLNTDDFMTGKGYDIIFDVDDCLVGVHSCFLFSIEKLKQLKVSSLSVDDMTFEKIDENGIIKVQGVSIYSLLVILHFLYTSVILKPWESFSRENLPISLRNAKLQCSKLLKYLEIINGLETFYTRSNLGIPDFKNFENDLTISLKHGEKIECCSLILRSRNAYFETLFSDRWDDNEADPQIVEFNHVTKTTFQIALDYLYGKEQLSLWDEYVSIKSIPEFINLQFDLIELSDELLLFGLKNFCQLLIKDFINQDNCLIILHHAENLNCQKLIGECLWFIYNNVDTLLTDPTYDELLSDQMITRIDKYCRWLNRINKFNIHETRTAWLDGDSDELLRKFLNDDLEFNDIFLESDDFVPLFEIKPEVPTPVKKTVKSPSPVAPPVTISTERKYSTSSLPSQRRPTFSADSGSAIDLSEDEFQPVINSRRRRSSAANKRRSSSHCETSPFRSITPMKNSITPLKPVTIPIKGSFASRNGSVSSVSSFTPGGSLDNKYWPSIGTTNAAPSPSSSLNSWVSNPISAQNVKPLGILQPSSPNIQQADSTKPSRHMIRNNSNVKLSQKERKRLMKQEQTKKQTEEKQPVDESPWKIPESDNIKPLSIAEAQTEALLIKQGIIDRGQFRDYQLNPQSVVVTKSFAEIQQEEEFAAWWESESQKVQSQMKSWNNFSSNKNSTPRSKSRSSNSSSGRDKAKSSFRNKSFNEPMKSKGN